MKKPHRLNTGRLQRRLQMSSVGWRAGLKTAANRWRLGETRQQPPQSWLHDYARELVDEIGKLKGSVVKVAQMLAIYGEHFLPAEVCAELHTLENQVRPLPWCDIEPLLQAQLGAERLAELDVERSPVAAASLAQIHRARRLSDGAELCLKIQYPGIAEAIDGDLDDIAALLSLGKLFGSRQNFSLMIEQARTMLHREVDYRQEAEFSERLAERLAGREHYIVPKIYRRYCSERVVSMSWECGHYVTSPEVLALPQPRRNRLCLQLLSLLLSEVYELGLMQSDPNFGNYLVRLGDDDDGCDDRLVLLDAGSVIAVAEQFSAAITAMIAATCRDDLDEVERQAQKIGFIDAAMPAGERREFSEILAAALEPVNYQSEQLPAAIVDPQGRYRWADSELAKRLGKRAMSAAMSRYFKFPPQQFSLLTRKLIGVFTLIGLWQGIFDGRPCLQHYIADQSASADNERDNGEHNNNHNNNECNNSEMEPVS